MNFQITKRWPNPFDPRTLRLSTRAAIITRTMLLLDTINNQILNRHTLLGEQLKIPLRFENTHRLRNRDERKTRLLLIVKHCTHGLNSLTQISEEDINFIRNYTPPRKMRNDVSMLLTHQIQ